MTGLFPRAARSPVCDGEMPPSTAHRRRGVAHHRIGRSFLGAQADVAQVLPHVGAAGLLDRRGPVSEPPRRGTTSTATACTSTSSQPAPAAGSSAS